MYIALEIEYYNVETKLQAHEELKLAKSFLFEFTHLTGCSTDFSEISYISSYDEDESEIKEIKVAHVSEYTEGMDLYRKAIAAIDDEIKFLYLYKIIEYYSPIAARRLAYDSIMKKLDNLKFKDSTNADIQSLISLAEKFRISQSDKELALTVLSEAVDVVGHFEKLPEEIIKKLTKQHQFRKQDFNYELKEEITKAVTASIGAILYSTRNSIVHAKSNYKSDGNECQPSDLGTLNEFLKEVSYSIISWYNRLPSHVKLTQ